MRILRERRRRSRAKQEQRIIHEDPAIGLHLDPDSGTRIVSFHGPTHVEVTVSRLQQRYGTAGRARSFYDHQMLDRLNETVGDHGELLTRDGKPISFSKEFARGMVKEKDQQFTDEQTNEIAVRYIQGLQHLTGAAFTPDLRPRDERIIDSTNMILDALL
jgi:hypothetical protein